MYAYSFLYPLFWLDSRAFILIKTLMGLFIVLGQKAGSPANIASWLRGGSFHEIVNK